MPPALTKAHQELDKAVDLVYRPQPFAIETKRMEFLFELYEKYTADLFTKTRCKKRVLKPTDWQSIMLIINQLLISGNCRNNY